jgi:UDP-N-acetylmuramyl pentapeptide phosphotransferase/UDP-N-acetylglucosamine-1-phosphate transferase
LAGRGRLKARQAIALFKTHFMLALAFSFVASLLITALVVWSSARHAVLSADHDMSGPQKFHSHPVPRVGGVGVFVAVVAAVFFVQTTQPIESHTMWLLIATSLPAFSAGLAEDLTKKVTPRQRLLCTALSACLAAALLDAVVRRTAIPGVDNLIVYTPFAIALTVLCVTGVAHATNIIDGFNGLASMCVLLMMIALVYVGFEVNDGFIVTSALIMAGAALGFFAWNYPCGRIFLGDGGAYLLGFVLAELSILLVVRNSPVSSLFPLALCAYPIFETLFTIYRRRVLKGVSAGLPDGIHLHSLLHRRVVRVSAVSAELDEESDSKQSPAFSRNAMTSPYLWLLCLGSVVPSMIWWNNTAMLTFFLFLFMLSYVFLYWRIVRFKTPRWLLMWRSGS